MRHLFIVIMAALGLMLAAGCSDDTVAPTPEQKVTHDKGTPKEASTPTEASTPKEASTPTEASTPKEAGTKG